MPPTSRSARRAPLPRGLTVAHTAQLDPSVLDAARLMVFEAFGDGHFDEVDWGHALGGMHAVVHEDGELVGHGSVVRRSILHAGRAWRVGYVEAVGVAATARRRGHGAAVMGALETVIRRRISGSTCSMGISNARDATKECRSSPDMKASMSPSSPERWAMIRISIWL